MLLQRCWDPPSGAGLVFNCQMGRGRTTTGMIIASLLLLRKRLPAGRLRLPHAPLGAWLGQGRTWQGFPWWPACLLCFTAPHKLHRGVADDCLPCVRL